VYNSKRDLRVSILDLNDNILLEDELGFHWEESYEFGGNIVKMSKASNGECFLWPRGKTK
jgi:alpha-glucosidase